MNSHLISLIIALLGIKGASPNQNENVHQTPTDLLKNITEGEKLTCKHKVKSYDTIVWYHRPAGDTSLKLVGFTSYKEIQTVEKPYEGLFNVSGNGEVEAFLHLGKLRHPENSGHYFCAVSSPDRGYEAYFGAGTKLTVLDRNIERPKVKVFKPSAKECQNDKHKKNKKTLLCVASDFYPDHVNVSWQIDGVDVKDGVATDHSAHWNGTHYRITSRLRVLFSQWFKPGKNFTCTVNFFDGKQIVPYVGWVTGIRNPGAAAIRNKYLKTTHNAKLSYLVLIIKSSIYGLFVMILVWKFQGFSRKPKK